MNALIVFAIVRVIILSPDNQVRTDSEHGNSRLFTGQYLDAKTGLYHYRARTY